MIGIKFSMPVNRKGDFKGNEGMRVWGGLESGVGCDRERIAPRRDSHWIEAAAA